MTENEAKRQIKEHLDIAGCEDLMCETEALEMAMSALEEIQQYRAIGTVEQLEWCKDASHWKSLYEEKLAKYEAIGTIEELQALKEKAEPKKPGYEGNGYYNGELVFDTWICPCCGESYEVDYDSYDYCPKCGQHIDHSGITEDD